MAIADYGDPASIATDLEQLLRRAMFNVMVGNRDDHLRNHGFLFSRGGWRLAPAFDMNPSPEAAEHALALDDRSHQPDLTVAVPDGSAEVPVTLFKGPAFDAALAEGAAHA